MISFKPSDGWTLIELISVTAIIGILTAMMINGLRGDDSGRADMTMERLMVLRRAILGSDYSETTEGGRANFGFLGDVGRMPSTLGELTAAGALPLYTYHTYWGIGAGWRGPYLNTGDAKSMALTQDAWSRTLTYSTVGTPSIKSLGADDAVGGASDNTDLEVTMPPASWMSTVTGIVRDGNNSLALATVALAYPVQGVLTTYNTIANSNGYFLFNTVPFGYRSARVQPSGGNAGVPAVVTIDRNQMVIPDGVTNSFGGLEAVTYQASSVRKYSSDTNIVLHLQSSYSVPVQLKSIRITYLGGGTYSLISLNGVPETITPVASSAAVTTISANMILPANSIDNGLEIQFSSTKNAVLLTIVLTWVGHNRTDTISFTP